MRSVAQTLLILFLFLIPKFGFGSHLRAGEIQVRRLNCNSLTVEITIVIYVNTSNAPPVGGEDDFLSFGDGSPKYPVSEQAVSEIIDAGRSIGKTVFKIQYTYKGPGQYVISYSEPNRNEGVVNMDLSINTRFHIETMVVLEVVNCNTYPTFLSQPIDAACHRKAFFHNPGGFDFDRDSLSFELAVPKKDDTNPVSNYRIPNHPAFYTAFAQGNESATGTPTFQIDPFTGLLSWDAPGVTGEYSVAIKMREWKRDGYGGWYESSYVIRDMQILVGECANNRPVLTIPETICVVAGEPVALTIRVNDPDGDSVRVDFFSELFEIASYQPIVSPASGIANFKPSPLELTLKMETSCVQVRSAPYLLTLKVSDRGRGAPSLTRFYTVKIQVIAPPPKLESAVVNPVTKQVSLQWSINSCENVQAFQIWRRTSSVTYNETSCAKGMPDFLRYDLLAVVPESRHEYTDTNLEIGSQYCYRIVALLPGNISGKLSRDTCLIPKPAEAPVITNVSVEDTDLSKGVILVKWTSPFEIDKTQYPPPYSYQVLRKNETLDLPFEKAGEVSDTTFTDRLLNTSEYSYRYFVELYVKALSFHPLDSSSLASSVVAESESKVDAIDLRWTAKTPWSNYADKHPNHLIFRSTKMDGPFELIDSINVLNNGFAYSDRGKFRNNGLTNAPYFYKVLTRGTYGNPRVNDPLENFSPVFFGQLLDTIPPCAPITKIDAINCSQFSCDGKSYFTSLNWESPDPLCDDDVVAYEVLVKSDTSRVYSSLGLVTQPAFRHSNLTNLDYCYRIISIDHVGNRSDSSVMICNTSCLNFKLPNVITPGTADDKNDVLSTYDGENSTEDQCARSVKRVELLVYNRWGEEIFLKNINSAETNILWPGVNSFGNEVASGVYFVKAKVDFQTNDPSKRNQEVKGWVHVLR